MWSRPKYQFKKLPTTYIVQHALDNDGAILYILYKINSWIDANTGKKESDWKWLGTYDNKAEAIKAHKHIIKKDIIL